MPFESEMGLRLGLEIFLKISCQRDEDLLLTREHAATGIARRGPSRLEVDAVECQPGLEDRGLHRGSRNWRRRRWWRRRSCYVNGRHRRSRERRIAVIADSASDPDYTGCGTCRVECSVPIGAGNVARARAIAVSESAIVRTVCAGADRRGAARPNGSGVTRACDFRRTRLFHSKTGNAGGNAMFAVIAHI